MAENWIFCDNCGAKCSAGDIFCKSCFSKLVKDQPEEEQIIEGIDNNDLSVFLGKNEEYYFDKFSGKQGKKHYFQLNWSALFFGSNWYFYRGMYKVVVGYYFISVALTFVLSMLISALYSLDVFSYQSAAAALTDYLRSGAETSHAGYIIPEYANLVYAYDVAQYKFLLMCIPILLIPIVVDIVYRLSANSIYRQHIIKNIGHKEGGASIATMIGGLVILNIVQNLSSYFITLITGINNIIG